MTTALRDAIDHTALGWVKPEIDETLRQARLEIEAFAESSDDSERMRTCAGYLHQVQGTLRMLELHAPAMVAEEMEQLAGALEGGAILDRDEACAVLMRGVVQLPDYLERLQGGHRDIPIVLLPLLNELRAARGVIALSQDVLPSLLEEPSEAEIEHARGSLAGRNRDLLDTVSVALKEDLLRVKDALDLHLRAGLSNAADLQPQAEALGRIGDTLGIIGLASAEGVIQAQRKVLQDIASGDRPPSESDLLEVASALIYIDHSLDDQVARLGQGDADAGGDLLAQESYKVMGVLAREAVANFAEVRNAFVAFVETDWDHASLESVPRLLAEVGGAMRVLQLPEPAGYLEALRRYSYAELIGKKLVPGGRLLDTLADALAGMEYYLESLREPHGQRQDLLDKTRGSLESLGYWPLPEGGEIESADAPDIAGIPAPPEVDAEVATPEPAVVMQQADVPALAAGFESAGDEIDDEIREIFLEEFGEEIDNLDQLLPPWRRTPEDSELLRPIRRVFHTLKGSGRLVGAKTLGEFSWHVENMLNRVLDGSRPASHAVVTFVGQTREALPQLHAALRGEAAISVDLAAMEAVADRLAAGEDVLLSAVASALRMVEVAAPAIEEPVIESAPAVETVAVQVDPVLLDILGAEVVGHLETVDAWLDQARGGDGSVNDGLLRAIHTLNGAFAMTEVPSVTAFTSPAEGYVKRLLAAGQPADAEGIFAIGEVADAVRASTLALQATPTKVPLYVSLAASITGLRNALPEASLPFITPAEIEREAAEERAEAEGLANEQAEIQRLAEEEAETSRLAAERAEAERRAAEEAERLETERLETERLVAERAAAERVEIERIETARIAAENAEADRLIAEAAEAARLEAERTAADHLEVERLAAEETEAARVAEERSEAERIEAERAAVEEATRLEAERIEAERIEAERIEANETAEYARLEAQYAEEARLKLEAEQSHQAAQAERLEAERIEAERLAELRRQEHLDLLRLEAERLEAARKAQELAALDVDDEIGPAQPLSIAGLDEDLLDIFIEEGHDLLDHSDGLAAELRADPANREALVALQRDLHTLKGGARMAGLMTMGDLGHSLESLLESVAEGRLELSVDDIPLVENSLDRLHAMLGRVARRRAIHPADALVASLMQRARGENVQAPVAHAVEQTAAIELAELSAPLMRVEDQADTGGRGSQEMVRIRADLLDRLVNYAGEVAIYRSRLEQQLGAFRGAMSEMEQTNTRLRDQLRRLDIETEAQIIARYQREQETTNPTFDPLELDRFSTLQQLSRALGESANDMSSLQGSLEDLTRQYETLLLQQSRVSTELQEGLMRTRMVPVESVLPRLRRVVRQASSDAGKSAQFVLEGAHGELDRNVLDRMLGPIEHLLRNAVAHGIEKSDARGSAGKPEAGEVRLNVRQEGSEVVLVVSDDGAGLDREAIRRRAEERGIVHPDTVLSDAQIDNLILESGFSTSSEVSQLSGRGVGMDVVNNEVRQIGGSLEIASTRGQGSRFTMHLPQTLAVTQAVFVRIGESIFAVPVASVRGVSRVDRDLYNGDEYIHKYGDENYLIHDLGVLLGQAPAKAEGQLQIPVLLVRAGELRVAVGVDQILGNREIVVKPTGPQMASIPGVFGATVMGDGQVRIILDIAPLARRWASQPQVEDEESAEPVQVNTVPLVMVVDDSITMRKVTSRVLGRQGFEVMTAKDGIDALEQMEERVPDLMLLDIEMPRMDGYELATEMKGSARLRQVPIVMITSRTGDKHRQRAFDLGVNRYLGKPYQETELLRNVSELLGMGRDHG